MVKEKMEKRHYKYNCWLIKKIKSIFIIMKKIFFICFLITIFSLSMLFAFSKNNELIKVAQKYKSQVSFYVSSNPNIDKVEYIQNGSNGIVNVGSNIAQKIYNKLSSVVGISFTLQGTRNDFINICENLELTIVSKEIVSDGIISYLCYTKKIANRILVDNEEINVQIAINKNNITVGTPVILGSY